MESVKNALKFSTLVFAMNDLGGPFLCIHRKITAVLDKTKKNRDEVVNADTL